MISDNLLNYEHEWETAYLICTACDYETDYEDALESESFLRGFSQAYMILFGIPQTHEGFEQFHDEMGKLRRERLHNGNFR